TDKAASPAIPHREPAAVAAALHSAGPTAAQHSAQLRPAPPAITSAPARLPHLYVSAASTAETTGLPKSVSPRLPARAASRWGFSPVRTSWVPPSTGKTSQTAGTGTAWHWPAGPQPSPRGPAR